jgi:preprotein translocase subunit SecB
MKPSPLNLIDLSFININVQTEHDFDGNAFSFDFDSVLFKCDIKFSEKNGAIDTWWVGLEFGMKSSEEKMVPYSLEISAVGLFKVNSEFPQDKKERLAYENGAALVFSSIREMVINITSRYVYGPLQLPTTSFVGEHEKYLKTSKQ